MFKKQVVTSWDIEVTKQCNMSCDYCYIGENKKQDEMNIHTAHHLVDFIKKIYVNNHINIVSIVYWGGEPLLNFDIIHYITTNLVEFGINRNIKFLFHLITNGTVLNEEMISFFKRYNLTIQISIDGPKNIHDSHRYFSPEKGSFDKVKENIDKLILNNMKKNVYLKSTFTRDNFPLQDTIEFFEKIGISYHFSPVLDFVQHDNIDKINRFITQEEVKNEVSYIINDFFNKKKSDLLFGTNNKTVYLFLKYIFNKRTALYSCGAGINMFCIDIYGDIYFCHQFALNAKYKSGSIYQNIDFNKFKDFGVKAVNQKKDCIKCGFIYICGSSCMYHELENNNYTDKIQCQFTTSMLKAIISNLLKLKKYNKHTYNLLLKDICNEDIGIFNVIKYNDMSTHIHSTSTFNQASGVVVYPLDEEGIILLEGKEEEKYIANATTMAIIDLLDGQRTAQEIAQEIANVCEVDVAAIKDDIYGQLAAFQELGLVEEVQTTSHA